MEERIELKLVGITYNQIESGVYALILENSQLKRRLAIVIGYPEAQSIECKLQNVRTPRPLTHDLLANVISQLGGELLCVDIHRLPTGPYAGRLTLTSLMGDRYIDARSSDAIALAIRVGAPIFTTRGLLEKEGYPTDAAGKEKGSSQKINAEKSRSLALMSLEALKDMLSRLVLEENYEEAARVKAEIERREKKESQED